MYQRIWQKALQEVSGERAHRYVRDIAGYHRIQVSPGIRAACEYALSELREHGLEAELREYPADGDSCYWTRVVPRAWSIDHAEAWLIDPEGERERIASFAETPTSVIQRCGATPPGGLEAPLVHVEAADEEKTYDEIEVEGKWVLTDANADRVRELAVREHGAVGIIYYGMPTFEPVRRHPMDVADARQYTAFRRVINANDTVGFVVSPRKGRSLVERLAEHSEKTDTAGEFRVAATVSTEFYDSVTENVEALIPGTDGEEVVIVAHICHPEPSANDNASGAAALLEAGRALSRLVADGALPKPKRTIRLLLVPEMTGSYTFLSEAEDRANNITAGINLDMVGADQEQVGSTLQGELPPEATPSFVYPLLKDLLKEVRGAASNPAGTDHVPEIRARVTRFSGGSDHIIFADPMVGVPMPMLINWPDRYYHTSLDTPEKVSPAMLEKVAAITATFAYWVADAGLEEALWLGERLQARAVRSVRRVFATAQSQLLGDRDAHTRDDDSCPQDLECLGRRAAFVLNRRLADLESVSQLVEKDRRARFEEALGQWSTAVISEVKNAVDRLEFYAEEAGAGELPKSWYGVPKAQTLAELVAFPPGDDEWEKRAADLTVKRNHPGPINTLGAEQSLSEKERAEFRKLQREFSEKKGGFLNSKHMVLLLAYYLEKPRKLLEAARLVELDMGSVDMEYVVKYVGWLERMKLVEFV